MSRLSQLFDRIASEQDELRARAPMAERLVTRLRGASFERRPKRRAWLPLAAALFVLCGVLVVALGRDRTTLAVTLGESGGAPLIGAWLGAPERRALPLEFSDGSRLELAPGSRARLLELERVGARVELASGTIRVQVVPRPATTWRLDAGPFAVRVTGTRFELSYSSDDDSLELYLEEGQVELSGCAFGKGQKLAAGQSVRASCKDSSIDVGYGRRRPLPAAAAASPAPPLPAPDLGPSAGSDAAPDRDRAKAPSAASTKPASPGWLELARRGAYREAYAAVESPGFEVECSRASAEALALLSDVARHSGASKHAEYALVTLRGRFPGTHEAALAAFALGRIEFDDRRAFTSAARWFRTYLNERPSGPMAREALGRLVEASERSGDRSGARALAARYLREYPSGPHAELSSRVVSSP